MTDTEQAWRPPHYADAEGFDEYAITLGSGPSAVSGTLSVPQGRGTHAGVVFLPGSGPADRDSTMGVNKPLEDLAWGPAARGVAVLRFDKIYIAHPEQVTETYTPTDEYVPHAVAAVRVDPHVIDDISTWLTTAGQAI
ncbi:hypothetical protein ACFXNW_09145 [Nocardia sp. NPDC059180]|uniref:hypothetical protein n=1 Tax=Nocardia sp. NPDC059180 TaxID=3346761 RepID=UPI0036ABE9F8